MQKQVRLVSMLLCLGMGVAGGLPAYASSESVSVQQPVNQFLYSSRTVSVKVSLKMLPVNRLSVLLYW